MTVRRQRRARTAAARGDGGVTVIAYVAVWTFVLVVLVMVLEMIVNTYGRAAIGHALDTGVRAATRVNSAADECQRRTTETMDSMLGGSMRNGATITCATTATRVDASATVTFQPWLPISPRWHFTVHASAAKRTA